MLSHLHLIALTVLAVIGVVHAVPTEARELTCPKGKWPCGTTCVDLLNDIKNCGQCGNKCTDTPCHQGACLMKCSVGATECPWYYPCIEGYCQCPIGQTLCYRQIEWFECADLLTDPGNCGQCNSWCDTGSNCVNGKCTGCTGNQKLCNGKCINPTNDNMHCGECYNTCGVGSNCVNGECERNDGCPPGQVRCDGLCLNLTNDNRHCGRCGNKCSVGKNCVAGVCR